jgi:hypothetical protein
MNQKAPRTSIFFPSKEAFMLRHPVCEAESGFFFRLLYPSILGCALTFASEAKFEIEAKISFCLEAKKKPDFT